MSAVRRAIGQGFPTIRPQVHLVRHPSVNKGRWPAFRLGSTRCCPKGPLVFPRLDTHPGQAAAALVRRKRRRPRRAPAAKVAVSGTLASMVLGAAAAAQPCLVTPARGRRRLARGPLGRRRGAPLPRDGPARRGGRPRDLGERRRSPRAGRREAARRRGGPGAARRAPRTCPRHRGARCASVGAAARTRTGPRRGPWPRALGEPSGPERRGAGPDGFRGGLGRSRAIADVDPRTSTTSGSPTRTGAAPSPPSAPCR